MNMNKLKLTVGLAVIFIIGLFIPPTFADHQPATKAHVSGYKSTAPSTSSDHQPKSTHPKKPVLQKQSSPQVQSSQPTHQKKRMRTRQHFQSQTAPQVAPQVAPQMAPPVHFQAPPPPPNPLRGYNIHVTAPHVMDGEVIGPFHHYCKPINSDIIQCILFESTDENARMTEVEYMVSKNLARQVIPQWSHRQNWHDHKQEIETGRVVVLNPTNPQAQKDLVDHVAKTDGIIFHLWPKGAPIPDGTVGIAQSVGHWEALHGMVPGAR